MLAGAAAAVAVTAGASTAEATGDQQVPGVHTRIDTTHATPRLVDQLTRYFRDKSAADPDRTMAHFDRAGMTYIDASLGWVFPDWQSLHDLFAQYMPQWPAGAASYATRIIGDENSAMVHFTDTAGMFGASEIRVIGAVSFRRGKIVRWIDYWDGRHYGVDALDSARVPDDQFPRDFREAGEPVSGAMKQVVTGLTRALRTGGPTAGFFAPDAVLEDLPSHIGVVGPRSIGSFLATAKLPFIGPDVRVRHVSSGGYEWTTGGVFPTGVTSIELDQWGGISRLSSMWNGARLSPEAMLDLAKAAVER